MFLQIKKAYDTKLFSGSTVENHDDALRLITEIYDCLYREKLAIRKVAFKKLDGIKHEKKPEPELLAEAEKDAEDIANQCAKLCLKMVRLKLTTGPPPAPT